MKTSTKYYKGSLRCQFQTVDSKKIGSSTVFTKQSTLLLEPRFRYDDVEEITEAEYLEKAFPKGELFIKRIEKSDVEFTFKNSTDPLYSSMLKQIQEIVLILEKPDDAIYAKTRLLDHFTKPETDPPRDIYYDIDEKLREKEFKHLGSETGNKFYSPFDAYTGKVSHGRIKGLAYCKEEDVIVEESAPVKTVVSKPIVTGETVQVPVGLTLPSGQGGPILAADQGGCFGSKNSVAGFNLGGAAPGQTGGCFGAQNSRPGCFNGFGMNRMGCMLPLLLLLLAGLLWWLLGMKGCQNNTPPQPIVIHDTILVEVQKIDTLTIVKTDTVSYVDSTTKLNYETVNLPNVQFITNSDVLLPSSASDLQKLAEYLIKNDSLTATIYGHTDNVGKPEENLLLSQRRAESVKNFLASLGVDSQRLTAVGKGDKEPKADNSLEEGRLMNRRVEVQLTNTEFVSTTRTKKEKDQGKNNKE